MDEVYGRGFTDRLTKALLAIDPSSNKEYAAIMNAFARSKFVAAANEDYNAIKETAEKLGLLRQE
jgi:phosphonate transport system substrate-binding protein